MRWKLREADLAELFCLSIGGPKRQVIMPCHRLRAECLHGAKVGSEGGQVPATFFPSPLGAACC